MRLLVDIGNSRTKYAFEKNGELTSIESTNNEGVSEEWIASIFSSVTSIIIASVSEASLIELFKSVAQQQNITFIQVESEKVRFGVTSSYAQVTTLGVDRWLTLLAANKYCENENVLIIDAGTATTADLLNKKGEHLGGWILPGIDLLFSSLLANTSQINANKEDIPSLSFGKSTSEGVNNACWAATLGFIEQAIVQANKDIHLDSILITGGNAKKLSTLLSCKHQVVHELVFLGLQRF